MGVAGFTTYFKGSPAGKILQLSDLSKDKKLVIGIDGNALFYYLARDLLSAAGSYINLRNNIVQFFERLLKFNIEPIVYLDALTPTGKYNELESRYQNKLSELKKVSNNLLNGEPYPFINTPTARLISVEFRSILKDMNIQTHVAFQETDYELTQWSLDNKDKVFGVISNDSDYFFFTMGDCYYLPLEYFKINDEGIQATGFKAKTTADYLQISERHLPLLATLIGNDYTKYIRSKYIGSTQDRITSIIQHLKRSKNQAVSSIIRGNYGKMNKNDMDCCLNSYSYYCIREEPKTERTGYYAENGIFFRYSQHDDFERVRAMPYYNRFFSLECMANYNFLSLLYTRWNQVSSLCIEPTIPYQNSLIYHISNLRQLLFGLLDYPPKDEPLKYTDLIPDRDMSKRMIMSPLYTTFGMLDCWNGKVNLEMRIKEFCSWFKVFDANKLAEISKFYSLLSPSTTTTSSSSVTNEKVTATNSFDDLLTIVLSRYLLKLNLCVIITEWMMDCWLFNYVLLNHGIELPGWSEFKHNHVQYMPVQITDFYASLYFLCYTILEVMNIPNSCPLKPPHRILDSTNLQLLFTSAVNAIKLNPQLSSPTANNAGENAIADRLALLFPFAKDLLTKDMIKHFSYLKNEVFQKKQTVNYASATASSTTTTTTSTDNLISDFTSLHLK